MRIDVITQLTKFSPRVFLIPSTIDAMAFRGAEVLKPRDCRRGCNGDDVYEVLERIADLLCILGDLVAVPRPFNENARRDIRAR